MAEIKEMNIEQLVFDDKNFNKHTEFGMSLIEKSIRKHGGGRSILIDKNNRIIGGNGVVETAVNVGLKDVIVVETDGTKLVAVKRNDVDLDTEAGREMALADNATAAADLDWDAEALAQVQEEFDINANEWGVILNDFNVDDDVLDGLKDGGFSAGLESESGMFQKSFLFPVEEKENIENHIKANGVESITSKIIELCRAVAAK